MPVRGIGVGSLCSGLSPVCPVGVGVGVGGGSAA